ncbi:MAG: hypothetical protein ACLTKG_08850 [Collinsella intestinalis]
MRPAVVARTRDFDGSFGAPADVPVEDVDYMTSPRVRCFPSRPRSSVPRARRRQAYPHGCQHTATAAGPPVARTSAPAWRSAPPSTRRGHLAKRAGEVIFADAAKITVTAEA